MQTQQDAIDQLLEAFQLIEDWQERYRIILDLGRKIPEMDDADKTEANRVHGCQSTVWMVARVNPTDPPTIEFIADSDSHIVRGLIAILQMAYSGKTPQQIVSYDIDGLLGKLDLVQHLSPTRRNGLHGMVERIKTLAVEQAAS